MYFTHPQLKFSWNNLKKIALAFLSNKKADFLEITLNDYFPEKDLVFTDMGRTAFRLIVEKLNLQNSEMLVPAYICDIFFPIFLEHNIIPIFLDIDPRAFNIEPEEIKKKITPGVKSLLLCHNYGLPNKIIKIRETLENARIAVIEDFSHAWGAQYQGQHSGNFGDVAFASLYKQFPCARGGVAVLNKNGLEPKPNLLKTSFSARDIISVLNYFPAFSFIFKKFANEVAPKMARREKNKKPSNINRVSMNLFASFWNNFEASLKTRENAANIIQTELEPLGFQFQESKDNVFCFLSALCPEKINRDQFVKVLKKYGVFATRIWHTPIILNQQVKQQYRINISEFPHTINASQRVINLPLQNYFSEQDARNISNAVKKALKLM